MGGPAEATRPVPATRAAVRHVLLVANARASGVRDPGQVRDVAAVLGEQGAGVETVVCASEEDLSAAWHRADGRRVVLMGGDGSVHAAANLPPPAPEVALIPAGRANNIAHCLGIPLAPSAAARLAVHGPARPLDLIDARGGGRVVRGVEGASAGFLALARARYHARNSADTRAAVRAGVAALARFHPLEVWLTHDGHGEDLWLAQLFVANIACFGTGLRVAPWADPRDGLLEVVALEAAGRRSVPVMLGRLRRGRGARCHGIHVWRAREVLVATRGASPVMVDTDDMGTGPVALAALPGALRLVAPGP